MVVSQIVGTGTAVSVPPLVTIDDSVAAESQILGSLPAIAASSGTPAEWYSDSKDALRANTDLTAVQLAQGIALARLEYLRTICEPYRERMEELGLALIARGGFGAGTPSRWSDSDLCMVDRRLRVLSGEQARFSPTVNASVAWPSGENPLVETELATWSKGDIRAYLNEADFTVITSLLSSRFIVGDEEAYQSYCDFVTNLVRGKPGKFYKVVHESVRGRCRESRFDKVSGNPIGELEADFKDGMGGLRDLDAISWIRLIENLRGNDPTQLMSSHDLSFLGLVTERFLDLKHEIHFGADSKEAAKHTKLVDLPLTQVELCELVAQRRSLCQLRERVLSRVEVPRMPIVGGLARYGAVNRFEARLQSGKNVAVTIMDIFTHFQRRAGGQDGMVEFHRFSALKPGEQRLLQEVRSHVNRLSTEDFHSEGAATKFREILGRGGVVGFPLRLMFETGVLQKMFPQFDSAACSSKPNTFHTSSIDEHMLRAVEAMDELLMRKHPRVFQILDQYGTKFDRAPLYFALAIHDLTWPAETMRFEHCDTGAALARELAEAIGFSADDVELIGELVQHHLLFADAANYSLQGEVEVVDRIARTVQDSHRRLLLALFTIADKMSSNESAWTPQKASAVIKLFNDVESSRMRPEELKEAVSRLAGVAPDAVEDFLAELPDEYASPYQSSHIAEHIKLANRVRSEQLYMAASFEFDNAGGRAPVPLNGRKRPDPKLWLATIHFVALDQAGLLSQLMGVFRLMNMNVREARIATRNGGSSPLACNTFFVETTGEFRTADVESHFRQAVTSQRNYAQMVRDEWARASTVDESMTPAATTIRVDRAERTNSLLISVGCDYIYDQPGLGAAIVIAIADQPEVASIRSARLYTGNNGLNNLIEARLDSPMDEEKQAEMVNRIRRAVESVPTSALH